MNMRDAHESCATFQVSARKMACMDENPYKSPRPYRRKRGRSPQELLIAACAIVGFVVLWTFLIATAWLNHFTP